MRNRILLLLALFALLAVAYVALNRAGSTSFAFHHGRRAKMA